MLVSYNWLRQYVDLLESLTPEELALKMTMGVVEVEEVSAQGENLENIVIGEITELKKHPDADKLQLCTVSDGKTDFPIVCGGSNLKQGMKIALGKIGAKVRWHGEGDLIELKKVKIRGEVSEGMICQSTEIGLGLLYPISDEAEILDLSHIDAKLGTPLAEALGLDDIVFDIDNKSMTHRPDLWGHYGMARELAAAYDLELKEYNPAKIKSSKEVKIDLKVKEKTLCPRYMAVAIEGVKVGPSPDWLQKRLFSAGLNPINNIVDITNYIAFDLGQPMHAFDIENLNSEDGEVDIEVRRADKGEEFVALDQKEYELTEDMLVISSRGKAVALAGVIGGEESGVYEETTGIVFEAANFDPVSVRRTSTAVGVRTDSSARFEKSLDPNNAELALRRAVELTLEICPEARVVSEVADESNFELNQGPIELSLDFLNKKIGKEIEKEKVIEILESLGFGVSSKKDILKVTIPTWRATKDISIPVDLVEEISRVYGYGNVETKMPVFEIVPPERNNLRILERKIKQVLSQNCGLAESLNYSYVSPQQIAKLGFDPGEYIELDNPIAKDRPYLRRHILTNLLDNLEKNIHNYNQVGLFEIGKIFRLEQDGINADLDSDALLPRQDSMLGCVYSAKKDDTPFFEVSSYLSEIMNDLGLDYTISSGCTSNLSLNHPARCADILVGKKKIGLIAELHPMYQDNLGIDSRVGFLVVNLNELLEFVSEKNNYNQVSHYPAVLRDIAFVLDSGVLHADVVEEIQKVDDLISSVELFDVFENKKLGENKKSMAYHIVYQSGEKTLEAEEVEKVHERLVKNLKKRFGVEVRD